MAAADDQLRTLIFLYEEEKIQLQKRIEESLTESEYLMAHFHSEAMFELNTKLRTLHNLDDRLYDEKEFLKQKIGWMQKFLETEGSDYMTAYYKQELALAEGELKALNHIPKEAYFQHRETFLDEIINKMLAHKIKKLKLVFKKKDNFFLSLTYSKKVLKLTIPYVKQHTKSQLLHEENMIHLGKLGFILADNETRLTSQLTGNKDAILTRLKVMLSKIVFEVFYYKEFYNDTYIEFKETGKH